MTQWRSRALPRYQWLTKRAEALIAAVYMAGTNTRRVKRARFSLFEGALSKDVVSRAWRKVKVDWDAWCARTSRLAASRSASKRKLSPGWLGAYQGTSRDSGNHPGSGEKPSPPE
jgi:hypothetical protein